MTACSITGAAGRRTAPPRALRSSASCSSTATATRASTSATSTSSPGAHGVTLSYTLVKLALQEAGLVRKGRARGRHRRRREPRSGFGELLHLDGSDHAWLARCPGQRQALIAVIDDATKRLLYAQLWPEETTQAVLTALRVVLTACGLPMALYTDRAAGPSTPRRPAAASIAPTPPSSAAPRPPRHRPYPQLLPQARGRVERLNRTLQDRLVNELRLAGITTLAAANAYLVERFIPDYNAQFTHPPADPASAFVPLGDTVDLEQLLAEEDDRIVGNDNTVDLDHLVLQLAKQPGRRSCARAARHRATPPQWRPHRLARPAVPGPLRRPGPPTHRTPPAAAPLPPDPSAPRDRLPPQERTRAFGR